MSLPPEVDKRIRNRFGELMEGSDLLILQMRQEEIAQRERDNRNNVWNLGVYHHAPEEFYSLQMKFLSRIQLLSSGNDHLQALYLNVKELENKDSDARKMKGLISGLADDYAAGMLDNIATMIEANIAGDYLGQAEQFLKEGQSGQFDHVPAAVLTGAILEDALRRLCQRQNPPIDVNKPNGEPKTLNPLIDDLKKASLFNELKAKQLRSWADIRNAAAHGKFDDFTRSDVEQMLAGVQNFLADYL